MTLSGQCGIIEVCLTDPFSQIISKIVGLKDGETNSVGFYYKDVDTFRILLFNVCNNNPIAWCKLGCSIELLLSSPFFTKIVYYPCFLNEIEFRAAVIQVTSTNIITDDYTPILMKISNTSDEKIATGYTLVKKVLKLCKSLTKDLTKFGNPIVITSQQIKITELDNEHIIKETRKEITKFLACFIELFTNNKSFREKILRCNLSNTVLISLEDELLSYLSSGIENGVISNFAINNIIKKMNDERIGQYQLLPLLTTSKNLAKNSTKNSSFKNVQVIDDDIPCTFSCVNKQTNTDPLRDLGIYINHIVESISKPQVLTIDLNDLISCYNNSIQGTSLDKIPHLNKIQPKEVIITASKQDIYVPNINSKDVPLTIYNGNLTQLSEAQLLDILVYIDSLRDSSGNGDCKFATLQNKIVHELARKHKN